jgi:thiamine-monophosphate kinase
MPAGPNDDGKIEGQGGEEALIAEYWAPLAAGYAGAYGLKDDCASIAAPPGEEIVVTTDAVIAGVHFFADEDPGAIGWKALAVNISDLIAKGATPLAYVMDVALPAFDRDFLRRFADGLRQAQEAFGCHLIGGDTDRTPGPLSVTITAFGTCPAGRMVRRATARPGDHVYVSGTIGAAALGLALRRDPDLARGCGLDGDAVRYLDARFSRPQPPLGIIAALRSHASAAMDISDGLMKDADRLCRASGVGARIEVATVPLPDAARYAIAGGVASIEALLSGGEDYEVLATVPPKTSAQFERDAAAAGVRVSRIGIVTEGPSGAVAVDAGGEPLAFSKLGWDHFHRPDAT